jgi:thiol-disulfide isomerase/thioredoxin
MLRKLLLFAFLGAVLNTAVGQSNDITIRLKTDTVKHILFAKYILDKLYVVDTLRPDSNNNFVINQKDTLNEGIYGLAFNVEGGPSILQFCLDNSVDNYSFYIDDITQPQTSLSVEGSASASALNDYLIYLRDRSIEASQIPDDENKQEKLAALSKTVNEYQKAFVEKNKGTIPAALVGASLPLDIPDFENIENDKERGVARWWYNKQHYFDYVDLKDDRLLYTPFLYNKINDFIENLTSPAPDSLNASLQFILDKMDPESDMFRAYLSTFLTKYATSKIVGYDAVYVFLAENYYEKGMAYWVGEEQLAKIVDEAKKMKPTLMGKLAPDMVLQDKDGKKMSLHEFESKYTILLFWAPDCGHCKKSMPDIIEFYNKFKDQGVEILGICTKFYKDAESCWDFVEEKGIDVWLNTMDPYHQSRYKILYNINSTPQIFILDKDKNILVKRIGSEQLEEVMQNIIENDNAKNIEKS